MAFHPGELISVVRESSVAAEKRSWNPFYDEPLILSGCFLYKDYFWKNDKEKLRKLERLNPENETMRWCQYLGIKLGQIEEQRTLHWVFFLLIILASFCINIALDQSKMAAKEVSLLHREKMRKMSHDPKRIGDLFREILRMFKYGFFSVFTFLSVFSYIY